MGYNTNYIGAFHIYKTSTGKKSKLPENLALILINLSRTRRMNRDVNKLAKLLNISIEECKEKYGKHGEFYFHNDGNMGQTVTSDVINFNFPPPTQPSVWCNFTYDPKENNIVWNENDKTEEGIEWINYILKFLHENGYEMKGTMEWEGEECSDNGLIVVDGKNVFVKESKIPTSLSESNFPHQFTVEQLNNMNINELFEAVKSSESTSNNLMSIIRERLIKNNFNFE